MSNAELFQRQTLIPVELVEPLTLEEVADVIELPPVRVADEWATCARK
ncbi:hypothetical protein [Burkholderia multivorans]|nr:hypothetical protein [Burkholderia multivorans]